MFALITTLCTVSITLPYSQWVPESNCQVSEIQTILSSTCSFKHLFDQEWPLHSPSCASTPQTLLVCHLFHKAAYDYLSLWTSEIFWTLTESLSVPVICLNILVAETQNFPCGMLGQASLGSTWPWKVKKGEHREN